MNVSAIPPVTSVYPVAPVAPVGAIAPVSAPEYINVEESSAIAVEDMVDVNYAAAVSTLDSVLDFAENTMETLLGSLDSFMTGLGQFVDCRV